MRKTFVVLLMAALAPAACSGEADERQSTTTAGAGASQPAGTSADAHEDGSTTGTPRFEMRLDYPFPPFDQAVELFDYDASEPLGYDVIGEQDRGGPTVFDVTYRSSGSMVPAYLVMPEGPGPFPVVLYAHGGGSGSRHYFLEDAVALARDGYAGLLITGPDSRPPYLPIGTTWDARMDIGGTVQFTVDLRRGIDLLETLPEIDAGRIGFVGYSAGAWPGAYLAGVEDRIDAFVLQSLNGWPCAGSASTTSCHVLDLFGYSDLPPQQDLERYLEDTMVLNPVPYVGHAEAAFLFQASRSDRWESIPTIRAVYEAASGPKVLRWYEGGHRLGCLGLLGPTLSCAAHAEAFVFHRAWLEEHV